MTTKFNHIVIGGTFDLLHAGHKKFIDTAFDLAKFVSIGVTTDAFNKRRGKDTVQNQLARENLLKTYLEKHNFTNRHKTVFISDIFGTSLNSDIDAIIATTETAHNAQTINKKRAQQGLYPLTIIKLTHVKDEDGKIISSTRIRNGEIDQEGRLYKKILLSIAGIRFDNEIISRLKLPLGTIISEAKQSKSPIISVGDAVTKNCLDSNIIPNVSIIDLKTHRKKIYNSMNELGFTKKTPDFTVINNPGEISQNLINTTEKTIHNFKNNKHIILVEGEEDLAVIPAVLLSPYNTKVLYGQPEVGIVEITVNKESKDKICKILNLR